MCDDKWQTRKNIVETIAFVLGGLLGAIWLFFSFSADKPLFQTFVSKNLSIGISLEAKGVVDTKPQTHAEGIILDVSNNGKATMSVLSGISMVWGFNYGAKKNSDSGVEHEILDEDNYLNKVNRRLYLGEPGIILRDYKAESITLLTLM